MPSDRQDNEFVVQDEVNKEKDIIDPNDCETVELSDLADDLQLQIIKKRLSEVLEAPQLSSEKASKEGSLSSKAEVENAPKNYDHSDPADLTGNQLDNTSNELCELNNTIMRIKEEVEDIENSHCEGMEGCSNNIFIGPDGVTVKIKEEPLEISSEYGEGVNTVEIKKELEEEPFIEPENVMVKIEEGIEDPLNMLCKADDLTTSIKEEVEDVPSCFDQSEDVIEPGEETLVSDSDDVTEFIKEEADVPFTCDHDYEGRSRKSDGYVKVYTECTLKAMAFIANEQAAKAAGLNELVEPKKAKMNDLLVNLDGELNSTEYIKVYPDEYLRGIKPHLKFAKGSSTDSRSRVSNDIKLSILEEAKANFTGIKGPEVLETVSDSRSLKEINDEPSPAVSDDPDEAEPSPSYIEVAAIRGMKPYSKFVKINNDIRPRVSDGMKLSILEKAKANFSRIEPSEPRGVKPQSKCVKESSADLRPRVSNDVKLSILEEAKMNFNREASEVQGIKPQWKSEVSENIKLSIIEEAKINFTRVDTAESQATKSQSKCVFKGFTCPSGHKVVPKSKVSNDVKLSILEKAKAKFSRVQPSETSKTRSDDALLSDIKSEIKNQVVSHLDEVNLPESKNEELFPAVPSTSFQQPIFTAVRTERKRGRPPGNSPQLPDSLSANRKRKLGFGLYVEQPGRLEKKKEQSLQDVVESMHIERNLAQEQLAKLDEELKRRPRLLLKTQKPMSINNGPKKKFLKLEIQNRVKEAAIQVVEDKEKRVNLEHKLAEKQLASLDKDTALTATPPFSPSTPKARLGIGSFQKDFEPIILRNSDGKRRKRIKQPIEHINETQARIEMERQLAEKQLASLRHGFVPSAPPFSPLTPKARLKMGYVTLKPELKPRTPTMGQINPPFRPICPPSAEGSRS